MPTTESRYQTSRLLSIRMMPKLLNAIKEVRAHCTTAICDTEAMCTAAIREVVAACVQSVHPHPTTITQGMHAGNAQGGHWRGREGLPVFSNCLWSSTTGLSTWSTWGTHVPSTIIDGEHVFGHSFGHFSSNHPLPQRNLPLKFPAHLHQLAALHVKMVMPFIWGGGYRTSYSYQGAYSLKAKRGENFLVGLKENHQEAFCTGIPI